jgi:cytochrome c553
MIGELKRTARIMGLFGAVWSFLGLIATVRADPSQGGVLSAQGDSAAGVPPCSACHGQNGEGVASVGPRLAGLSKNYILDQLAAFRTGARKNPIMQPIASALTAEKAGDVADYLSSATAVSRPVPASLDAEVKGRELAEHGRWADGLPACDNCHAPAGVGVAPDFPYLAGQQAGYIEQQIQNWRAGERKGDSLGLMRAAASKLRDDDIAAVAAYFASLPAPKRQGEN